MVLAQHCQRELGSYHFSTLYRKGKLTPSLHREAGKGPQGPSYLGKKCCFAVLYDFPKNPISEFLKWQIKIIQ